MNLGYPVIQHLFRSHQLLLDQFQDYRLTTNYLAMKRLHHRPIDLAPRSDPRS